MLRFKHTKSRATAGLCEMCGEPRVEASGQFSLCATHLALVDLIARQPQPWAKRVPRPVVGPKRRTTRRNKVRR